MSATEQVYQDRQYQIDAAIVRLMKTHREVLHSVLLEKLSSTLAFPFKVFLLPQLFHICLPFPHFFHFLACRHEKENYKSY